jgi:hypothetical protein
MQYMRNNVSENGSGDNNNKQQQQQDDEAEFVGA